MTMPPFPEPKPDDESPHNDEGLMGFILGPRDNPDGTPIKWTYEHLRRLRADLYHFKRIAEQHGLKFDDLIEIDPSKAVDTQRSKDIAKVANPAMAEVVVNSEEYEQTMEVEQPDGTKIKLTNRRIKRERRARLSLERAIEALGSLKDKFKWSARLRLRFGKHVKAEASVGSGQEEKVE